jgi:hypothetical protein
VVNTLVDDIQEVTDTNLTLFSSIQQGPVGMLATIQNLGTNAIVYVFQEFDGTNWNNIGALGSPTNGALVPNQVVSMLLVSAYAQIRMQGYASGGSTLGFSISRFLNRSSGGPALLVSP